MMEVKDMNECVVNLDQNICIMGTNTPTLAASHKLSITSVLIGLPLYSFQIILWVDLVRPT